MTKCNLYKKRCCIVDEGKGENEFILMRHSHFEIPVNVLNMYGQQECRMNKDEIDDHWREIMEVINSVEARKESLVWIGDFNRHVGPKIPGNDDRVSYGGNLLIQFLESEKYILLNASDKSVGEPWTRIDPTNKSKSALDFVIISEDMLKYVNKFDIDNGKSITPFKTNDQNVISFTDHLAIYVIFRRISLERTKKNHCIKSIRWNFNKPGGWIRYKELTSSNKVFDDIAISPVEDPDVLMKKIDNELNTIRFKAFGKVKIKKAVKVKGKLESLLEGKKNILEEVSDVRDEVIEVLDNKIVCELKARQKDTISKEFKKMYNIIEEKGKCAAVFKVKKAYLEEGN